LHINPPKISRATLHADGRLQKKNNNTAANKTVSCGPERNRLLSAVPHQLTPALPANVYIGAAGHLLKATKA